MTIEVTAKKVQEAINNGLEQLGATIDEVTVEVLESGGLFRKAKVRLTLDREEKKDEKAAEKSEEKAPEKAEPVKEPERSDEKAEPAKDTQAAPKKEKQAAPKKEKQSAPKKSDARPEKAKSEKKDRPAAGTKQEKAKPEKREKPADREKPEADTPENGEKPRRRKYGEEERAALAKACEFIAGIVQKMGFDAKVEPDADDPELVNITADAGDDSLLIGRHGETLSALSYLAETGARAEKCRVTVTADCNGYRGRRAASLSAMAHRRADECANKRRKIKLEPMERIDRRTIHNALGDDDRVTTASEGKEPYRYVVILPRLGRNARQEKPRRDYSEDDGE